MYLQAHDVEFDYGRARDQIQRCVSPLRASQRRPSDRTPPHRIVWPSDRRLHQLCLQLGPSLATNSSSIRYDGSYGQKACSWTMQSVATLRLW
jgi:hypothetical protein